MWSSQIARLAFSLIMAVASQISILGAGDKAARRPADKLPTPPSVQVSSVTLDPPTIYRSRQPFLAVVTVQVKVQGQAPRDAQAKVEVATYSADPPGNKVKYSEPQSLSLDKPLIIAKFTVEITSDSVPGTINIAASIDQTSGGVQIRPPEASSDRLARLAISDP
jgi:hypothetical protein